MTMGSPSRGSSSLDRYMRVGSSGRTLSHSPSFYANSPTKPKRLQSAHFDETTGDWRCKRCGYGYPSPEPHHHVRREHKKICPGGLTRLTSQDSGLSTDEGSQGNSNVLANLSRSPTTPDTATSKLAPRQEDKTDEQLPGRSGSEIIGDGVQSPQLLDRGSTAHEPPSSDDLRKEDDSADKKAPSRKHLQEAGDAKSEQPEHVESGEHNDELGAKPSLHASDKSRPHEPTQNRSEHVDFPGFMAAPPSSGSGQRDGGDVDMDEPLSQSSQIQADGLKGAQPAPSSNENEVKQRADDSGEGLKPWKQSSTAADKQAEVLQDSEDHEMSSRADDDTEMEKAESSQDRDKIPTALTEGGGAHAQSVQLGEASRGMDDALPAADSVLREQAEDVGSKDGTRTRDLGGTDNLEHGVPHAVAEDDMDYEGGDGQQSGQAAGDVGDEASQNAELQGQSDLSHHTAEDVGDLEITEVGAGLSEPGSAAEGVSETPLGIRGMENSSGAQRNWEDWEHVVSEEGKLGKSNMSPFLREIDDAAEVFLGDGEISHRKSDQLEDDSADKKAPTSESEGAVLESDRDAGHEMGSQPGAQDWEYLLEKSIEQHRGDSLPSTSADHEEGGDKDAADQEEGGDKEAAEQEEGGHKDNADQEEGGDKDTTAATAPIIQQEDDQAKKAPLKFTAAEANWDDWQDVINDVPVLIDGVSGNLTEEPGSSNRDDQTPGGDSLRGGDVGEPGQGMTESQLVNGAETTRPVSESDLGVDEHQNVVDPPNPPDKNSVDRGSIKPAELVNALHSPPVANNSGAAVGAVGLGGAPEGLNHKKEPNVMATSVPDDDDDDTLFRIPKPVVVQRVAGNGRTREFPDSGVGAIEGRKGVDSHTSPDEFGQAGTRALPPAERGWDDWEDVHKNKYVPGGSRPSSPSFGDGHDGELSSDNEYAIGLDSAVKLPLGKKRWADWEDLAKSEYMVLDGPAGESLIFKRASDPRGSPSSAKSLRERESPSFEGPDNGGGSPRLRSRRLQPPSFDDDKPPSSRAPHGAAPKGVGHSHSHPAHSPTKSGSHPSYSPRKSEGGDSPSRVVTRRPLLYRDSRRDYTSEVEDMDASSAPQEQIVHLHDHNLHEYEDALKYNVEKVLRNQTKYELICPICGALITRKIVIRKKKRKFVSGGDPRWRRNTEITPVDDNGNQSPRSDISSEVEDASASWKRGIRPCFGYFFGSS